MCARVKCTESEYSACCLSMIGKCRMTAPNDRHLQSNFSSILHSTHSKFVNRVECIQNGVIEERRTSRHCRQRTCHTTDRTGFTFVLGQTHFARISTQDWYITNIVRRSTWSSVVHNQSQTQDTSIARRVDPSAHQYLFARLQYIKYTK